MKKVLLLALVAFSLVAFLSPPERLAWDQDKMLEWSDFKGTPKTLESYAASSSTGMSQSYEIDGQGFVSKASIKITAHFYPEFSWYREKDTSDYLLAHEQAHFDITEIHARKLRKAVSEYQFTSRSKQEIKALYQKVEKQRVAMQQQFDLETDHSRNRQQESAWHQVIHKMLRSTGSTQSNFLLESIYHEYPIQIQNQKIHCNESQWIIIFV